MKDARFLLKGTLLIAFICTLFYNTRAQNFWPDGKKAAIALTYDDGIDSQLKYAIPQLDAAGFKGTFFLYGYLEESRFEAWKKASDKGHEIGNHSLYHPCRGENPQSPRFSSDNYDVPSIIREIGTMGKLIFAITGKNPVSYAYPCGETEVGGIDYSDSLKNSGLVKFARNGEAPNGVIDFQHLDYFKVPAYPPKSGSSSKELINYVKRVLVNQGFGVFLFHGIGGDYLTIDEKEHQKLINFLVNHKDEIWVAPFGEIMEYIQKYEKD